MIQVVAVSDQKLISSGESQTVLVLANEVGETLNVPLRIEDEEFEDLVSFLFGHLITPPQQPPPVVKPVASTSPTTTKKPQAVVIPAPTTHPPLVPPSLAPIYVPNPNTVSIDGFQAMFAQLDPSFEHSLSKPAPKREYLVEDFMGGEGVDAL